jgi:hypothetical protein
VGGLWLVSSRSFHVKPWFMFDYKGDNMIADIEDMGAREVRIDKKPTTKPGLYIVRPDPSEPRVTNDFLMNVWRNEQTGLYFDEGFMVPQHRPYKGFDAVMTQGRQKQIPVIACYQRPAWLSPFALASAEYLWTYHLLKPEDRAKMNEYIGEAIGPNGEKIDVNYRLPKHYSLYYDVNDDCATVLRPVPHPDVILETFSTRLTAKRKGLFR